MSDLNTDQQGNEDTKTCTKCNQLKPYDNFNADSRRKDGKRASCKDCDADQKKRIREDNLSEYRRRNAENNRNFRARKQSKNTSE